KQHYPEPRRAPGAELTTQAVATELQRTLVGSIGLVASVPITTGLAALVAAREEPPRQEPPREPARPLGRRTRRAR
ncbi:YibE/F family protein, partial [Pseudonocardia kujensis]|uniref:YibE/F family protein n=1 Tax=Pseudonocardia kujensis TaxID=1128675 RepID=UPI001E5A35D4